jgi:RecA-family ATPase
VRDNELEGSGQPDNLPNGRRHRAHDLDDLVDEYGAHPLFTRKEKTARGNGGGPRFRDAEGRLKIEEAVAALNADGANVNDIQPRIIMALLHKAVHPDDIIAWLAEQTIKGATGDGADWRGQGELEAVTSRCRSAVNKLNEEYDVTTGVIPGWLSGEFHKAWQDGLAVGRRPKLFLSHGKWHVRTYDIGGAEAQDEPGTPPPEPRVAKVLELRPFKAFDPATLPPREWLYGRHYQRRTVSLTAGPGGMGKSSLVLVECIAMATARNLLGEQPTERLRVWVHNGEDPLVEINRRVAAICLRYDIPQEELEGYLWLTSGTEFPLRVAKGYNALEINDGLVRQISNVIGENQIDVAAFDPLVTLHSVSEGDPGKMDAVIRVFAGIADEHDASIELNHHVRKPAAGIEADIDLHDIRGAMAITDAVRAARVLNRMSRKDAETAAVDENRRLSHFRVDKAKGNYSPAQAAVWRRFINIPLPNGDDVGVVAPWDFPGQGVQTPEKMAADIKAERVFLQLLDKFTARGVNVNANTGGPNNAPSRFATEKGAKAEKVSKAMLRTAMTRLLDDGKVLTEPIGRGDRTGHRLVRAGDREAA